MENASKALLMAAGILIGIIIASLFAYEMYVMAKTGQTFQKEIDNKAVVEFNNEFQKYEGIALNAQEVVTIYNHAMELSNTDTPVTPHTNLRYLKDGNIQEFLQENWNKDNNRMFSITVNGYDHDGRINEITIK